ncbi:MAG: hypothetical protein WDN04_01660 [Rhodospirillales bacterium]
MFSTSAEPTLALTVPAALFVKESWPAPSWPPPEIVLLRLVRTSLAAAPYIRLLPLSLSVTWPLPVNVRPAAPTIRSVVWLLLCNAMVPLLKIVPNALSVPWLLMSTLPVLVTVLAVPSSVPLLPACTTMAPWPLLLSVPPCKVAPCRITIPPAPLTRPALPLFTVVPWITRPPPPVDSSKPLLLTTLLPVLSTSWFDRLAFTVPDAPLVKLSWPTPSWPAPSIRLLALFSTSPAAAP